MSRASTSKDSSNEADLILVCTGRGSGTDGEAEASRHSIHRHAGPNRADRFIIVAAVDVEVESKLEFC